MFSRIFIDRPRMAIVISLIMVLTGVISLRKLPIAEYPEIAPPTISVTAVYPGASAEVIMQTVAMPLEDQINTVDDLLYMYSTSDNAGSYSCQVTFKSGTNTDMAMVNLQNAVKRAEPKLPTDVTKNGITVSKRGGDILSVIAFLTDGTSMDQTELNNFVQSNIKDALTRQDGVSAAEIFTDREYSMRIWLDPIRMAGLAISTDDINRAVASQNIQAAAGSVGAEHSSRYVNYKVNVQGRLRTAEEFEQIVLRRDSDGSLVRLRDVARVEVGSSSYAGEGKLNGSTIVPMGIFRSPDANALATVNRVKAELESWRPRFPAGVDYEIAYDPTTFITASMREIVLTLLIALALVVLITWVFLQDWRATLIPSIAIPVSMIATFAFMYALGFSINVLTMFGLILVIGSLCDDAIVVVENCQALLETGLYTPKEAAKKCMEQITGAIIATTLVTVACYAPLAFYGGMVGAIYVQFAVTMCISLCLSTLGAMTLSPALCAILLKKPDGKAPVFFRPFNWALDGSRNFYVRVVGILARRAVLTLFLLAITGYAGWRLFHHIDNTFLPAEDKGVLFTNIELPYGASIERTEAVLRDFQERAKKVPGVKSVLVVSGHSLLTGVSENVAMSFVALEPWEKRITPETQIDAIKVALQQSTGDIADAKILFFAPPAIMGLGVTGGATFNLCAQGEVRADELSTVARTTAMGLMGEPEVMYAMTGYNADTPQLFLDVDREKAEVLGVEISSVFSTLQAKLASLYINDFTMEGRNYKVKMQSTADYRATMEDIREIQLKNSDGEMVPLTTFATLRYMTGPRQIARFNKMMCADMNAQGNPGISSKRLMELIEKQQLPENFHVEWTGLSYQERQNEGQIILLMAMAMLFAYLFLVAQYESWTIPVPVMLSVLFAITGALTGILLWKETLSIYAQLGLVMLIGLSGKSAILMVEFSKQERESGKSIFDAAMAGARLRYRAVLMTAWSFVFGVFPLVVATGAGSGSRRAIGITTFSGMIAATLVGIFFTPALYAAFQRMREAVKGWRRPPAVAAVAESES